MKLTKSQLREIIKEVLDELDDEVDEATTTGSVDGYMTPHAFSKSDEPDDEYVDRLNKSTGYTRVNEGRLSKQDSKEANRLYDIVLQKKAGRERTEAVKGLARIARKYSQGPITTMKQVLATLDFVEPDTPGGHLAVRNQKLKEGTNRYQKLRKDERTPNQKIGVGIRELRKQLQEIEKFVTWYGRIKNEAGLEPSDYWKRTQRHLTKISERLNKLSIKVKEMSV